MTVAGRGPAFGIRLRNRRHALGLSQLRLAVDAGVSPRHLSFIETGRAQPSREMVLRLAARLGVPLRDQNQWLLAAGFAPAFAPRDLGTPELAGVRQAAALVLESHDPFPAVALDRRRDVIMANRAAGLLQQGVAAALAVPPVNIYRLILHPEGLSRRIVNFPDYGRHLLARLRGDAEVSGDAELGALLAEVAGYPGLAGAAPAAPDSGALTLRLLDSDAAGALVLTFVTTIATFGTPFDLTVSEIVIETLVPADAATAKYMRARR